VWLAASRPKLDRQPTLHESEATVTERPSFIVSAGDVPEGTHVYPLHPSRRADIPADAWWSDVPPRELGPHDGLPLAARGHQERGRP